ncbi:cytochrome c, partial [Tropicimonas marinistellae]|uniref:cytochrome c n=1 Tax=Tropicimonas marinistellae TaxID=1739787 RepID=UPI00122E7079
MKLTRNLSVATGITLVAATAFAHSGAMGIVKERMDGMSAMAAVMKALAPMMQGTAPYDPDAIRKGAATIA